MALDEPEAPHSSPVLQRPGPSQSVLGYKRQISGPYAHKMENTKSARTMSAQNAPALYLTPMYDLSIRRRRADSQKPLGEAESAVPVANRTTPTELESSTAGVEARSHTRSITPPASSSSFSQPPIELLEQRPGDEVSPSPRLELEDTTLPLHDPQAQIGHTRIAIAAFEAQVQPHSSPDIEMGLETTPVVVKDKGKKSAAGISGPTGITDHSSTPPMPSEGHAPGFAQRPVSETRPQDIHNANPANEFSSDLLMLLIQKLDRQADRQAQLSETMIGEMQSLKNEIAHLRTTGPTTPAKTGPCPLPVTSPRSVWERKMHNPTLLAIIEGDDADMQGEQHDTTDEELDEDKHERRLKSRIRCTLESLLNVTDWSQIATLYPTLTESEVTQYLAGTGEVICTEDRYYIDFKRGWRKFALNKEVREVFIDHYLKRNTGGAFSSNPTPPHLLTREHIGELLDDHMDYCQLRWRRSLEPPSAESLTKRAKEAACTS
ncbi:hypothetical protein C8Q79DRAFT_1012111 [Trametes meyenii]|nr:hypothetical protein C8Q79DRAFT_1012111 [Trametes meyenii]